jgi:hypothetical protein
MIVKNSFSNLKISKRALKISEYALGKNRIGYLGFQILVCLILVTSQSVGQSVFVDVVPGAKTLAPPPGCTKFLVDLWGGGGGNNSSPNGGGGGSFVRADTFYVNPNAPQSHLY